MREMLSEIADADGFVDLALLVGLFRRNAEIMRTWN